MCPGKTEKQLKIEKALENYFQIANNTKISRFRLVSQIGAFKDHDDVDGRDMDDLWAEHQKLLSKFNKSYNNNLSDKLNLKEHPDFSFLDLKIKIALKILRKCFFCEKRCMVDRTKLSGETVDPAALNNVGQCGVSQPRIASEFLHFGEETILVPSHTIFFTGCTFSCVFCQNWDISQNPDAGAIIQPEKLSHLIDYRRQNGSRNVNFVGGDPTPNLHFILQTMASCQENIPVVWNSNFYMSTESMNLLQGFVDLYLSDFKFGNKDCALRLAGVRDYWKIVTGNHIMAKKSGDVIIRHLVLPGHFECCTKPILDWIYENLGSDTVVNVMGQYRPVYQAHHYPEISQFLSRDEWENALQYGHDIGLENII